MSAAEDWSAWPVRLREIAQVIGRDLALKLAAECGGIVTYIPNRVHAEHAWCKAVGEVAFAQLVDAYGGQRIDLPLGSHINRVVLKTEIIELAEQGLSVRAIAVRLRTTMRHVRRVLEGLSIPRAPDPKQMKLF